MTMSNLMKNFELFRKSLAVSKNLFKFAMSKLSSDVRIAESSAFFISVHTVKLTARCVWEQSRSLLENLDNTYSCFFINV